MKRRGAIESGISLNEAIRASAEGAVFSVLFSVVILLALVRFMPHMFSIPLMVFYTVLFCAVIWCAALNRFTQMGFGILLTGGILMYAFTVDVKTTLPESIAFLQRYLTWVNDSYWIIPETQPEYLTLSAMLMPLGVGVLVSALIRARAHFGVLTLLGAALFFSQQMLSTNFSIWLFFAYCAVLAAYAVWSGALAYLRGDDARRRILYLVYSLPLCVLIVFGAGRLPVSTDALGQPISDAVGSLWLRMFGVPPVIVEEFSFAGLQGGTSVFSDTAERLGGPFRSGNDNVLLYIEGDKPLYLRGRVADTYLGNRWHSGNLTNSIYETPPEYVRRPVRTQTPFFPKPYVSESGEATLESQWQTSITLDLLLSLYVIDGTATPTKHMRESTIYFWDIASKNIFMPQGAVDVKIHDPFRNETTYRLDQGDILHAEEIRLKEFSYTVYTPVYDREPEDWDELYKYMQRGTLATIVEDLRWLQDYLVNAENVYSPNESERIEQVRERFKPQYDAKIIEYYEARLQEANRAYTVDTELPESVPERVYELAREIVSGLPPYASDYEKAKAIEAYLVKNYTYNLDVPATPGGRDFVDYFLFDLKEGYCTYFASAMTVLCRAVGVPTRYVEGFVPADQKIEELYYVTAQQAHAWPEIYIEMFGWVPVEPTPPMNASFVSEHFMGGDVSQYENYGGPYPEDYVDYEEEVEDFYRTNNSNASENTEEASDDKPLNVYSIILYSSILLVLLMPVYHRIRRYIILYRMANMPYTPRRVERLYRRYLRLFRRMGMPRYPHETAIEYGARLDENGYYYGVSMREVGEVYNAARYGGQSAEGDDRLKFVRFWAMREEVVRDQMGKVWLFIYKNILGLI